MSRALSRRSFLGSAALPLAAQPAPPNIIVILTDDQGYWDVSAHGNPHIETPQMDRLAAEGVSYRRFYASPVCAPTRASLMTGRYYLRTGIYNTRFGGDTLQPSEVTLAELLRERGYRTALYGKWHLGHYRRYQADQRGFDDFLGFTQGHIERYFHPDQLLHNGRRVRARGHVTDLFTDSAISFVRQNKQRPFFLYLAYNVPHSPNYVENEWTERYLKKGVPLNDAQIYGMLSHADRNIGRLLKTLDDERLRENTMVVFLSDNGGVSRHYRAGLRGNKGNGFEGGIRVPCFVRFPGRIQPGTVDTQQRAAFDLFSTVCDVAGARPPQDRPIDGKSLFSGGRHASLCHIWDRFQPSMRSNWSISEERWKLVRDQLFDLPADGGEKTDVAAKYPREAERLRQQFETWLGEMTSGRKFEPLSVEVGRPEENPVELMPSWARLSGTHVTWPSPGGTASAPELLPGSTERGRNYSFAGYDWDTIDTWSKPGDRVEWPVDVLKGGRYKVTLGYGCGGDGAGGKFRFSVGSSALTGTTVSTGGRNVFESHEAGTLVLAAGRGMARLELLESGGSELMSLNRVWLERIS